MFRSIGIEFFEPLGKWGNKSNVSVVFKWRAEILWWDLVGAQLTPISTFSRHCTCFHIIIPFFHHSLIFPLKTILEYPIEGEPTLKPNPYFNNTFWIGMFLKREQVACAHSAPFFSLTPTFSLPFAVSHPNATLFPIIYFCQYPSSHQTLPFPNFTRN